jgi:hypothetical protein
LNHEPARSWYILVERRQDAPKLWRRARSGARRSRWLPEAGHRIAEPIDDSVPPSAPFLQERFNASAIAKHHALIPRQL